MIPGRRFLPIALALLLPAAAQAQSTRASQLSADLFARGYAAYFEQRFADALQDFQQAVAQTPGDAKVQAWLAFAYFRNDRQADAARAARAALAIEPCNTTALEALSRSLNPQYGQWEHSDPDSAWAALLAAAGCDSLDGDIWADIWIGALARGQTELAARSVRGMAQSGMYRPMMLAYTRWTIRDLPEHAVWISNGDADTYPVLVIQQAEALRRDVSVVNLSMLALPWYRRYVRDALGVPMPFESEALDSLDFLSDGSGGWITPGTQILKAWKRALHERAPERPIVLAVSVESADVPVVPGVRRTLCGGWWRLSPGEEDDVDTLATARGLARLRPEEFVGGTLSEKSRSPYRSAGPGMVIGNLFAACAACYGEQRRSGDVAGAERIRRWGGQFFENAHAEAAAAAVRDLPRKWREATVEPNHRKN